MTKVLVLHGAGIDMRGKAQVEVFGPLTMAGYDEAIRAWAGELGLDVDIFHSNVEGEVINRLYAGHNGGVDAAIINPAGYTTGHPALAAAIAQVGFPTIEVHLSNPSARRAIRNLAVLPGDRGRLRDIRAQTPCKGAPPLCAPHISSSC